MFITEGLQSLLNEVDHEDLDVLIDTTPKEILAFAVIELLKNKLLVAWVRTSLSPGVEIKSTYPIISPLSSVFHSGSLRSPSLQTDDTHKPQLTHFYLQHDVGRSPWILSSPMIS